MRFLWYHIFRAAIFAHRHGEDFHVPTMVFLNVVYSFAFFPLVGGLEHGFDFSIYWECHHPN